MNNRKYTICDGCPCLNNDRENGSDCSLKYETNLRWIRKSDSVIVPDTPEMRSHQKDFELKNVSLSCKLFKIITAEKVFYRVRVRP